MATHYTDLSIVLPVSKSYWPNAKLALRTLPSESPKIICWYGPGEPDELPTKTQVIFCKRHVDNFWRSYVCNVGIQVVQTKYVLITDADFLYPRALWKVIELHPETVIRTYLGMLNWKASDEVRAGKDWEHLFAHFMGSSPNIMDDIYGNHNPCFYPTEILLKVRGYDERMVGWGGEDMNLSARTALLGLRELRLPLVVAHLHVPWEKDYLHYERGKWETLSHKIAHSRPESTLANPNGWGDL